MTLSRIGRISKALVVSMAVVLGMSACGGYTVGFMWVLGTQYNQIAGFKIDDYTGNLTNMVNSPYCSGGTDPVSIAVRVGGNFVFVVNKGTTNSQGKSNGDGNVSVFCGGRGRRPDLPGVVLNCRQHAGLGGSGRYGNISLCAGFAGSGLRDHRQRRHHGIRRSTAPRGGCSWCRTS